MPPVGPEQVPLTAYNNWPGIDARGHVKIDRARVRAIAARLEAHLEEMLSADKELRPTSQAAYGQWDAAQQLYRSVQTGHNALVDQHSRFLHATMEMIKKLHASAAAYDEAESELERKIAAVDKRLHVVPSNTIDSHSNRPPAPAHDTTVPNSLNPEGRQ